MALATNRLDGMLLREHWFSVPLDYAAPERGQIEIFAREVVSPAEDAATLPWLVFFQGGPGFPAPRPLAHSGWIKRAICSYRVLLLDMRGTGRSSPVTAQTLAHLPSARAIANYLMCFRADSIVADAELIRRTLPGDDRPWSVLGQSYGGFCITQYLSAAPEGLASALITGGLPPLNQPVNAIYRAIYHRVIEHNRRYYANYPDDILLVQQIMHTLQQQHAILPDGARLTPRRFQQLGIMLGSSQGYARLHYLLEDAFVRGPHGPALSETFLRAVAQLQTFETYPIYAILHESIYCQQAASRWAAERVRGEFPLFEPLADQPVFFTGEMIYPWMFDDYPRLRPLRDAAEILANYSDWPVLYDVAALRRNQVPCAAAIYDDDMYVEREFSEATAATIQGIKVWRTSQYQHDGLRADGEVLLDRLLGMLHGEH